VNHAANAAGSAAAQVQAAASELSQQSERLDRQVAQFLSTIRAA
jgi:methyl-accepting chemotaxis protein